MFINERIKQSYFKIIPFLIFLAILFLVNSLSASDAADKLLWHPEKKLTLLEYLEYSHAWRTIAFALTGGLLLVFLKIKNPVRASLMVLVFIVFAILPSFSGLRCALKVPSPICAFTKPLLILKSGNYNISLKFLVTLSLIGIFSVIGNKLFCSWVCPVGALQEAVHLVPYPGKKKRLPFFWMNILRVVLSIAFIPVFFVIGRVTFDFLNPFVPIYWGLTADFWTVYSWIFAVIVVIASFFLFRPYCYLVCPIGLITWLLEHISIFRIRFDRDKCDSCKICIEESSCPTVESIIEERRFRPDCHSCGKCVAVCPNDALKFRFR